MTAAFVGCTPHTSWGSQLPLLQAHTSAKTSGVTFPSCMGFCSLLRPWLDGTKGHPREGWGTGGRAATLDRHPGERQAVTSSLPPTRQSLPLLVHHLSGWRGACPTPAGLPGEVTENKTNAGAERGDRESAVWRDRAHARLAEAKKTQPGEAPAPRLRPHRAGDAAWRRRDTGGQPEAGRPPAARGLLRVARG